MIRSCLEPNHHEQFLALYEALCSSKHALHDYLFQATRAHFLKAYERVEIVPKEEGIMFGFIVTCFENDKFCKQYFVKMHSSGCTRESMDSSSSDNEVPSAMTHAHEIFMYKYLEVLQLGAKFSLFYENARIVFLVTEDVKDVLGHDCMTYEHFVQHGERYKQWYKLLHEQQFEQFEKEALPLIRIILRLELASLLLGLHDVLSNGANFVIRSDLQDFRIVDFSLGHVVDAETIANNLKHGHASHSYKDTLIRYVLTGMLWANKHCAFSNTFEYANQDNLTIAHSFTASHMQNIFGFVLGNTAISTSNYNCLLEHLQ